MSFGSILKQYRQDYEKSQGWTAKLLDISRNHLSSIERGESGNPSYELAVKILNLPSLENDGKAHKTIEVTLSHRVEVDAVIAQEIVFMNSQGVVTVSSCQGPPAIALILPSSMKRVEEIGYFPVYQEDIGLFQVDLWSAG